MSDDRRGGDQEGEVFRRGMGIDVAAEADLPGCGIALQAGEEPACFDSRDLLGDIEQGVDGGLDLEGGSEEVAAFQEGVDRAGEGADLVGRDVTDVPYEPIVSLIKHHGRKARALSAVLSPFAQDRKSTRLNSSHIEPSRMPSSA